MNTKNVTVILACLTLTLLSGVIRGYFSNRWGVSEEMKSAAERVAKLPLEIGEWHAAESTTLGEDAEKMLRCTGNSVAVYVHQSTGENVSVVMMVGPAGPLAQHTPDVCYRSSNYGGISKKHRKKIVDNSGQPHDYLSISMRENSARGRMLRVYYSWNQNGAWTAPESPRTIFAGVPMLYKIQVATHVADSQQETDAAEKFLKDALPSIQFMYTAPMKTHRD